MVHDAPIFIVIPVHNRWTYTRECLESLRQQTVSHFAVIVVDDGSTDGTGEMIGKEFPSVILLKGDGNLWWAGSTNLGVQYALQKNAQHIVALNNDTVVAADFLENMLKQAKEKPRAIMGALAFDAETKEPVYGGEIMNRCMIGGRRLLKELKPEERKGLHRVTHYPTRGLWIPAQVFGKIGLFDALHFPMTSADYDFTLRAARSGYEIYCNYDSKVYIYEKASATAAFRSHYSLRNYIKYLTDIRSAGNLKYFVVYAFRNCPLLCLPAFLAVGLIFLIFGYPKDWVISRLRRTGDTS